MPQTILNRRVSLAKEEEESLVYLLKCPALASDLLYNEALVNVGLISMELEGNFLLEPCSLFSFGTGR